MKNDTRAIPIRAERMMDDLDAMRDFGRTGSGVVRQAFSQQDLASRAWLAARMREAGLAVHVDEAGNVFGVPPGEGPCLLVGSHSDTQPEGGWLDGVLGVVAGLELARASLEAGGPRIACVSFQDEEGRFGGLTGSRIWAGQLSLDAADRLVDPQGVSFAEARAARGDLPPVSHVRPADFAGFLEMHIEQGPFLDASGERIGVVDRIVGIREIAMRLEGEQNHAGTTPMHARRDAVQGMVAFATTITGRLADLATPATVWTIGEVRVHPNASSIVPGRVDFSFQWRDAETDRLDRMQDVIEETAREIAAERGLAYTGSPAAALPPTSSDAGFVEALSASAQAHAPGAWRRMPSGALHDAANVSAHMPTAMLFVPSIRGISHSFEEDTERADLMLGADVLADAAGRICAGWWG